jgi:hypothetical protein
LLYILLKHRLESLCYRRRAQAKACGYLVNVLSNGRLFSSRQRLFNHLMVLLDGFDREFAPFQGADGVQGGSGGGHGGSVGDVVFQGHEADGVGIAGGFAAFRGVDQQGDFLALDAVDDVGRPSRTL